MIFPGPPRPRPEHNAFLRGAFRAAPGGAPAAALDGLDLDYVSAWSIARRLTSNYTGPLIRVRADREGQPEQDIGYRQNNELDIPALAAFLAGSTGYVTVVYGQIGVGFNWDQSTASSQPAFNPSGINAKPAMLGDGSDDSMVLGSVPGQVAGWWGFSVFRPVGGSNDNVELWAFADYPDATDYILLETIGSDLSLNYMGGNFGIGETLNTDAKAYFVQGGPSGALVRSSAGGSNSTGSAMDRIGPMRILGRGDNSHFANVFAGELILGNGQLNITQQALLFDLAAAYWSTSLP